MDVCLNSVEIVVGNAFAFCQCLFFIPFQLHPHHHSLACYRVIGEQWVVEEEKK